MFKREENSEYQKKKNQTERDGNSDIECLKKTKEVIKQNTLMAAVKHQEHEEQGGGGWRQVSPSGAG